MIGKNLSEQSKRKWRREKFSVQVDTGQGEETEKCCTEHEK